MTHPNLLLIDQFFACNAKRDLAGLRNVLAEDGTWTFPGHSTLSGTKSGLDQVLNFFDEMGAAMGAANAQVEKLFIGANDDYVVETQHIHTKRPQGPNLDQAMCVLWRFKSGKIAAGAHLVSDQDGLDQFFSDQTQAA